MWDLFFGTLPTIDCGVHKTSAVSQSACILATGIALPTFQVSQEEAKHSFDQRIAKDLKLSESTASWVFNHFDGAAIESLWSVCPKLTQQFAGEAPGLYGDAVDHNPTAGARNRV